MGVMEFGIVRNNIYRILITKVNDLEQESLTWIREILNPMLT